LFWTLTEESFAMGKPPDRMTIEELKSEIRQLRADAADPETDSFTSDYLIGRLRVFEQELTKRSPKVVAQPPTLPIPAASASEIPDDKPRQASTVQPPLNRLVGVVLGLIGCVLLIAAFIVEHNLTEKDAIQERLNTAMGDLGGALTGRYEYKQTRESDRAPVYALGSVGAILLGMGGIALAMDGKRKT
jgi:hypothetical protein